MPKLRVLSGPDVTRIFQGFGFEIASQKGSHVKLKRELNDVKQIIVVPAHDDLDKGTLKAIYNQSLRFIPENDLRKFFYNQF
jgi:predicted RNA binding protein YcfA (HicA-like mRNA interferase family)